MTRRTIFLFFITLLLFMVVLLVASKYHSAHFKREEKALLDRYYALRESNPTAAKKALEILLQQDPYNQTALVALGDWYFEQKDYQQATHYLQKAYQLKLRDPQLALKLAQSYIGLHQLNSAMPLLQIAAQKGNPEVQHTAETLIANPVLAETVVNHTTPAPFPPEIMTLFNQYYAAKQPDPAKAESLLKQIIQLDPKIALAYLEYGYLAMAEKKPAVALPQFIKAFNLQPSGNLAAQIGYLLFANHQWNEAKKYFQYSFDHGDQALKQQSQQALVNVDKQIAALQQIQLPLPALANAHQSERDKLFNQYYNLKKTNPVAAWNMLQIILQRYPNDVDALKEAGYTALNHHNNKLALCYFLRAFALTADPTLAMQIGYILDKIDEKHLAYFYFDKATKSQDPKIHKDAEQAMTNLAGWQTKILYDPFFAEIYAAPYYFSRFDLASFPFIGRAGFVVNKAHLAEIYLSYRWTRDDRSYAGFLTPQIYDDNAEIISIGTSLYPFQNFPLLAFAELGRAYDLVYRFRPRWRGDFRSGLVYYNTWGAKPAYTDKLNLSAKWTTEFYGDSIFYTRYQDDLISNFRLRQGFNILQIHSTVLNVYMTGHTVVDTNQYFYNNIFEWGPGVVIHPDNRYAVALRFETLRGYYFPVNGPYTNPYGAHYHNNVAQLELYMRF